MKVEYFRAQKQTHRFRKNQKVWISYNYDNHLDIYFRWRGKGRYVRGTMSKDQDSVIGEIKSIEVSEEFAKRIINE